jgi:hypothetical protein
MFGKRIRRQSTNTSKTAPTIKDMQNGLHVNSGEKIPTFSGEKFPTRLAWVTLS